MPHLSDVRVDTVTASSGALNLRADQRQERHAAVHALPDRGLGISAIADVLGIDRKTVRHYAHAPTPADPARDKPFPPLPRAERRHSSVKHSLKSATLCDPRVPGYDG